MIKLIDILKKSILNETELTDHYIDRKNERTEILDIAIPPDAYVGYSLNEVKDKLIPLLKEELLKRLATLENQDIPASDKFNIGYQIFAPSLENKNKSYPIRMTTKATIGGSSVEKETTGVMYGVIIRDNTLVTLLILNSTSAPVFKDQITSHSKRKDESREIKIFKSSNCDFTINIDVLFGKEVEKPQEEKIDEEDLPYRVRTDYRAGTSFTYPPYGTGKIVTTSSGTKGTADSRGMLDWIDVDFGKPYVSGGKMTTIRRIKNIYSAIYFDKQLKND